MHIVHHMTAPPSADEFDVIVIGSGIGGMTTAAALSRMEHKILLLEQAQTIGGLTHAFSRNGFTWDVGLHYCGTFGHDQPTGRILDWLSGGTIEFRSVGTVYDVLHFPDGFEISVARPAEAYKMELKERFPGNAAEIDAYFGALQLAEAAVRMIAAERSMPEPFRSAHRWWNRGKIQRWCQRTTGEVIADIVSDPKLAAVLSAQWGTYGGKPTEASFGVHATVMSHYLEGAGYPVGGAAAIAKGLVPVIEAAGQPLVFRMWTPECEMIDGPFGARVPATGAWVTPDIVIVPLVAFDGNLNRLGYGDPAGALQLDLVYNPGGAFLPPPQGRLESAYKQKLAAGFEIRFDRLLTLTNLPIRRFADELMRRGSLAEYMQLLVQSFNPVTISAVMCRSLVSVAYDGKLFDCDFNQTLDLPLGAAAAGVPSSVFELQSLAQLQGRRIATAGHCFGCTAGAGSSCGGALAEAAK